MVRTIIDALVEGVSNLLSEIVDSFSFYDHDASHDTFLQAHDINGLEAVKEG